MAIEPTQFKQMFVKLDQFSIFGGENKEIWNNHQVLGDFSLSRVRFFSKSAYLQEIEQ